MKIMIKHAPTGLYVGGDITGEAKKQVSKILEKHGFDAKNTKDLLNVLGLYPCVWEMDDNKFPISHVSGIIYRRHKIDMIKIIGIDNLVVEDGSFDDDEEDEYGV